MLSFGHRRLPFLWLSITVTFNIFTLGLGSDSVINSGLESSLDSFLHFALGTPNSSHTSLEDESKSVRNPKQIASFGTNIFLSRKRFNTSAGFYIPAFSFIVPDQGPLGSSLSLANQAIYGLFSALTVAGMFAEPMFLTRVRPPVTGREASSDDLSWESSLNRIKSSAKLNSFMNYEARSRVGLDGELCLQKTICSVFRRPDRYGKYAWPFITFITPKEPEDTTSTWYERAAHAGKFSRDDCGHRFKCFFDLLDLMMFYVDWFTAKLNAEMHSNDSTSLSTNIGEMRVINAYEEPFYKSKVFNQTFRLCVPIAGFSLPFRGLLDSTSELANQVLYFLFIGLILMMIFAVPILFTGTRPFGTGPEDALGYKRRGFDENSDYVMHILGLDVTNHIGTNSARCLQRSICEAHRNPKAYGLIGLPFRMFFPPISSRTKVGQTTWYQEAARVGKHTNTDCSKSYYCFTDILNLINYMTDWWVHLSGSDVENSISYTSNSIPW